MSNTEYHFNYIFLVLLKKCLIKWKEMLQELGNIYFTVFKYIYIEFIQRNLFHYFEY